MVRIEGVHLMPGPGAATIAPVDLVCTDGKIAAIETCVAAPSRRLLAVPALVRSKMAMADLHMSARLMQCSLVSIRSSSIRKPVQLSDMPLSMRMSLATE